MKLALKKTQKTNHNLPSPETQKTSTKKSQPFFQIVMEKKDSLKMKRRICKGAQEIAKWHLVRHQSLR